MTKKVKTTGTSIVKAAKEPSPLKKAVQEALQTTWVLLGNLKRAQLQYMHIGALLTKVRDEKMYEVLKHPDLETYAAERLHLGRASLYRYLQVYEWISKSHPEWLEPKAKGFIPDLSDCNGLRWIESQLESRNLTASKRAALAALHKKALAGELKQSELDAVRKQGSPVKDGSAALLAKLRLIRRRAAQLANMQPEVIAHLDAAIGLLNNDNTLKAAGMAPQKDHPTPQA